MARITLSTVKKFIRDNAQKGLFVKSVSSFDSMTDSVEQKEGSTFSRVVPESIDFKKENDLGIDGLWLVRESRDFFYEFDQNGMKGYRISNSCGVSIIAVKA